MVLTHVASMRRVDLALTFNPEIDGLDISLDGVDLRHEDTLMTAAMLSLLCDRAAQPHEVPDGTDRRGWWADTYAENQGDAFGSRLWLLAREKQLPEVVQRARRYSRGSAVAGRRRPGQEPGSVGLRPAHGVVVGRRGRWPGRRQPALSLRVERRQPGVAPGRRELHGLTPCPSNVPRCPS